MKYLITFLLLLLTGCGTYDKTTIDFKCIDGKLVADKYDAKMVKADAYIKLAKYKTISNQLIVVKDADIQCTLRVSDDKL